MRWLREPYLDYMAGRDTRRPLFTELFGLLIGLDEEWRAQGAAPQELDLSAFEWDYVERCPAGGDTGPRFDRPRRVIEETDTFRIEEDGLGRVLRLDKRTATIPLPLSFPVASMDDWLRLKPMFEFRSDRIESDAVNHARRRRDEGAMITINIPGGFDTLRELMGEEAACLAYYDQPELVVDVLNTLRDTALRVLDEVSRQVTIDVLHVHEDFAGRSGPLVGPAQVDEFIRPYYRSVWDLIAPRGTTIFNIDSDGNIDPVIPSLMACGINEVYPMEPAAGMDIVSTRERYGPSLMMRGGIDKFIVRNGTRADIRRELEYKMQPMMLTGGVVFALDHRIPNGTPLESYRYYVDTGREILGLPPRGRGTASDRVFVRSA